MDGVVVMASASRGHPGRNVDVDSETTGRWSVSHSSNWLRGDCCDDPNCAEGLEGGKVVMVVVVGGAVESGLVIYELPPKTERSMDGPPD